MLVIILIFNQWLQPAREAKFFCAPPLFHQYCAESTHTYNVLKYELNLAVPMTARSISGTNTIKCRSMVNGLNAIPFHCRSLTIDSVNVDGSAASYSTAGETLFVTLPQTYDMNDSFTAKIGYHGSWPVQWTQSGFVYYPKNYNGNTLHANAYSLGEPWDARAYMPCYDDPFDKADQGCVHVITVPDSFVVCANGGLVSVVNNPGGTKTYTWQENFPIATYLMHFGVSRFAKWSDWYYPLAGDSIEIRHFIWPQDSVLSLSAFQYVPLAMQLFDSMYGSYPFTRYGQDAVYPYAWGGMEHQEQTTIHRSWILNSNETYMAHELSHQWWGDMVTCVDFRNIWLNEGFASYSHANYNWLRFGHDDFIYTLQQMATDYFNDDAAWRHPLYDPPVSELFNWGYSYCKGAWVVHMLRYLDQANFFNALSAYRDSFEYGTANTEDLKNVFNQAYGTDLTWFFDEWVYDQGYPIYDVYWDCLPSGGNYLARVRIFQIQDATAPPVFHMPVQLELQTPTIDTLINIPVTGSPAYIERIVSDSVTAVIFDPDEWLLEQHYLHYGMMVEEYAGGERPQCDLTLLSSPGPDLRLEYSVAASSRARLAVYDISGRLVREIRSGQLAAGRHQVAVAGLLSGVYFCRLETPGDARIKKAVVVK